MDKKEEEIKRQRKRLGLFFTYMGEKLVATGAPKEAMELQLGMRKIAEQSDNLSELDALNKEVDNWLRNLPDEDIRNILKIFRQELDENFSSIFNNRIDDIKIEGIRNDDEFRLINNEVNHLIFNQGSLEDIELMNQMLRDYELTNSNKG